MYWKKLSHSQIQGWTDKILTINNRTTRLCKHLEEIGIEFCRNPYLNILAIKAKYITNKLAQKYFLVPDNHVCSPKWYKAVVMSHVKNSVLDNFILDITSQLYSFLTDLRKQRCLERVNADRNRFIFFANLFHIGINEISIIKN